MNPGNIEKRTSVAFYRKSPLQRILFVLAVCFTLLLENCGLEPKNEANLLKLYGNGQAANFSKNYLYQITQCHVGSPGAFLASPGDLLFIEGWMLVNGADEKSTDGAIHFIASDSLLIINGKTVGIAIDSTNNIHHLIDVKDKNKLRDLKVLAITANGIQYHKKTIELIAKENPDCTLYLVDEISDDELQWIFGLFNSEVICAALRAEQEPLLASEQQLKTLYIQNSDSQYACKPLPSFPNLTEFIFVLDENEVIPSDNNKNWLQNNPQLKKLTVNNWNENYPKGMLDWLKAPETLLLSEMEIQASEILQHKASLQKVFIDSLELQYELPNVKWITLFMDDDAQKSIEELLAKKPLCEVLDLFANGETVDANSLINLKNLKYLTLSGADSISLEPLKQMKQLKLLAYETDSTNMDSAIAVLQTALPDTVVVANEGFCMGSGWLLLSIPTLLAAIMLANRKRENKMKDSISDTA